MEHLHKYQRIGENEEAVVEICSECKKKLITRKYGGRIDNKVYMQEHKRDILQPDNKLFKKYYGNKAN